MSFEDKLSISEIQSYLKFPDKYKIEIFDSIDSTNTRLKQKASQGAKPGHIIIANSQFGGKGRLGREFFSPPDSGLYFSLLVDIDANSALVNYSPPLAVVALSQAVDKLFGIDSQIKWVNDLYVEGKKIAGILSEGVYDTKAKRQKFLVLGIGINVYKGREGFPEELQDKAGYLLKEKSQATVTRNQLLAEILKQWEIYSKAECYEKALKLFRKKNFLQNKTVEVFVQGRARKGKVIDINHQFALVLEDENGLIFEINHGEATLQNLTRSKQDGKHKTK